MRQIALTLLLMLLVACGQKGDLYIPDPSSSDSSATGKKKEPAPKGDEKTEEEK